VRIADSANWLDDSEADCAPPCMSSDERDVFSPLDSSDETASRIRIGCCTESKALLK